VTESYRKVVLASGHMVDAPDRPTPRFPAALESVVAAEIERVLDGWGVGPGDLVLNGGARGTDILFAESGHRRGADVEIVLARPPGEFATSSVTLPRSIWHVRFTYLLRHHRHSVIGPDGHDPSPADFARANAAMFARARELAPPAELHVALVWDGRPPGGPGGTGELAETARQLGIPFVAIDPTHL